MKVKLIGYSCSSKFCILQEVQLNDTIQSLIVKIEHIVPCTKVIHIIYDNRKLNKNKTIKDYNISDGSELKVQTESEDITLGKPTCMGCGYYNLVHLSANVARAHETTTNFSLETIKNSLCQSIEKLNPDDQKRLIQFINGVTEGPKTRFIFCLKHMFEVYVKQYRNTDLANLVDFNYSQLLNELRCPVCFVKFSLYSQLSNTPVQICTVSDKHYTCQECFKKIQRCPLCNGEIHSEAIRSKHLMDLLDGSKQKIEAYCLLTELNNINIKSDQRPFSHGAFCNVYRVEDYAIKCPHVPASINSDIEGAILHEIFIARPLSHIPNILTVYGGIRLPTYGMSIVMEFIDGPSLAAALNDDTIFNLTFNERLDIALGICKGLGELHLAGIVHRDFKPANVLLKKNPSGNGYIPKIADFGVSFLIQTASATAIQKQGGTVGYDAPEVADGNVPSFESDIYALAFTLYELLTTEHPFIGLKDAQILRKFTIAGERPKVWNVRAVSSTTSIVPDILKDVIEKGWLPEPNNRTNIGDFIYAIRKAINPNYTSCIRKLYTFVSYSRKFSSYDFINEYNAFELLAIQEVIKRLLIEDSEAIELLLNDYAWG